MIEIICDRCGKKIKGTTYYTIDIKGKDINSVYCDYTNDICSASTVASNIRSAFESIYFQKHYCEECIDKVRDFLANKEEK